MQTRAPIMNAFQTLIAHNIPQTFPKLRFAFVEAGASWVPYLVYNLRRARERRPRLDADAGIAGPAYELAENLVAGNRFYVTCQVDEDLPYILKFTGEDNLMVGSDYSHSDPSQEGHVPTLLQERADRGDLSPIAVRKILWDNPKACYGL